MDEFVLSYIEEHIEDFLDWYENDINGKAKEKELLRLRKQFVREFSVDFVKNTMTLEDYCLGRGNSHSFCYIIERSLRGLGSILGANASKFGVYYSNGYLPTKRFGETVDKAFDTVKSELIKLIDAANNKIMATISDSTFSYTLRHKIYFLYNPLEDIPVFSEEHLDTILAYFDIEFDRQGDVESNKRKALYDFKLNQPLFRNMTNRQFMMFLYSEASGIDIKKREIISKGRTKEEPELIEISALADQIVVINEPRKGKTNYDDVAAKLSSIGNEGEKIVLKYEKRHHPQYAKSIKRVSLENDHLGYDILSFDDKGQEVYIEVKTKKHGSLDNIDFFITAKELEELQKPNHVIYYVCGVMKKGKKRIYVIRYDDLESVTLTPILYRVKAKALV